TDSSAAVSAFARRGQCRHLRIQPRIGLRARARRSTPPLQIARARHRQQLAHPADRVIVAIALDPGVPHRDSFAKYAAAFFTISKSSLALASSRRSRAFSASSSDTGRFTAAAAPSTELDVPSRLRRTQFVMVDCGIPSRLAAALPLVDSANLIASVLHSSVYL